ncbi:MAG: hypothetical protein IPJ06_08130 [Saprospiraceae bacterium]|nr:hypothetical protein [Saprospiraceae bacterium]
MSDPTFRLQGSSLMIVLYLLLGMVLQVLPAMGAHTDLDEGGICYTPGNLNASAIQPDQVMLSPG